MTLCTKPPCLTSDIASEKCHQEKRKTVNGEDILFAMTSLGFENYAEALKIYLSKYREVSFPYPVIVGTVANVHVVSVPIQQSGSTKSSR